MSPSTLKKRWKSNLLLLLISAFLCLLAAEAFLRLAGVQTGTPDPVFFTEDDTLGWVGKPDFEASFQREGRLITYQMNRWGFRDDQPPPGDAVQGKRRLMLLGDSYAMGYEIPKEDRVSELLEKADSNCVVYNFGILGYSADQELLVLQKFGPAVQPNVVLLFFCVNDIYYSEQSMANKQPKPLYKLQPDGALALTNVPLPAPHKPNRLWNWLSHHSALGKTITNALLRYTENFEGKAGRKDRSAGLRDNQVTRGEKEDKLLWSDTAEFTDLTYYILRDLRDQCRRWDAPLIVFMCPSNERWTKTQDDSPAGVILAMRWCDSLVIPHFDLFPLFRQEYLAHQSDLYIYDRMHWNASGDRLVAEAVLAALRQLKILGS